MKLSSDMHVGAPIVSEPMLWITVYFSTRLTVPKDSVLGLKYKVKQ